MAFLPEMGGMQQNGWENLTIRNEHGFVAEKLSVPVGAGTGTPTIMIIPVT